MYPDLMGSAGMRSQYHEGVAGKGSEQLVGSERSLAPFGGPRKALPHSGVSYDLSLDLAGGRGRIALYNSDIDLPDSSSSELLS